MHSTPRSEAISDALTAAPAATAEAGARASPRPREVWWFVGPAFVASVEIPAARPNSPVARKTLPVFAAVIRAIQPALFRINDQINPLRVARRERDADAPELLGRQPVPRDFFPMISAVIGAIEPASGAI
jgi:hypothetical protein